MRRPFFNALFSLVLLASYVWGGCVSCESFFMVPGGDKHCCDPGKCKKPNKQSQSEQTQKDCERMPLNQVAGARVHFDATAALIGTPVYTAIHQDYGASVLSAWHRRSISGPSEKSPPDLQVLNVSFQI